jgi:hypothetical protein
MKTVRKLQAIALLFYALMLLKGSMIAVPFLFYLVINLSFLGTISQGITGWIAILGLILWIRKKYAVNFESKNTVVDLLIFIILLAPVIERFCNVSTKQLDYPSFKFPLIVYVCLFGVSFFWSKKTEDLMKRIKESFS